MKKILILILILEMSFLISCGENKEIIKKKKEIIEKSKVIKKNNIHKKYL